MRISSIWHLYPRSSFKPKTTLIISLGVLLGVIAGMVHAFLRRAFSAGADDPDLVEHRFNLLIFGASALGAEQARLDRPIALPSAKGTANDIKRLGTQQVGDGLGSAVGLSAKTPLATALQNTTVLQASRLRASRLRASRSGTQPLLSTTHPFDTSIEGLREFIHV